MFLLCRYKERPVTRRQVDTKTDKVIVSSGDIPDDGQQSHGVRVHGCATELVYTDPWGKGHTGLRREETLSWSTEKKHLLGDIFWKMQKYLISKLFIRLWKEIM